MKPFYGVGYALLIAIVIAAVVLFLRSGIGPQEKATVSAESTSEAQGTTVIDEKPLGANDHNDPSKEPAAIPPPTDR